MIIIKTSILLITSGSMSLSHEVDMARRRKIDPRNTFPTGFRGSSDSNSNTNTADVVAQGWRTIRNGWTATFEPPTKPARKSRSAYLSSKKTATISSPSVKSSSSSPKTKSRSLSPSSPSLSSKSPQTATVINSKKGIINITYNHHYHLLLLFTFTLSLPLSSSTVIIIIIRCHNGRYKTMEDRYQGIIQGRQALEEESRI